MPLKPPSEWMTPDIEKELGETVARYREQVTKIRAEFRELQAATFETEEPEEPVPGEVTVHQPALAARPRHNRVKAWLGAISFPWSRPGVWAGSAAVLAVLALAILRQAEPPDRMLRGNSGAPKASYLTVEPDQVVTPDTLGSEELIVLSASLPVPESLLGNVDATLNDDSRSGRRIQQHGMPLVVPRVWLESGPYTLTIRMADEVISSVHFTIGAT